MKRAGIILCWVIGLVVLGIVATNLWFSHKESEAVLIAESAEKVEFLVQELGQYYYPVSNKGWSKEWYEKQFSIILDEGDDAVVFHPPGTWPNFLLIVVSDSSGRIKHVYPRHS